MHVKLPIIVWPKDSDDETVVEAYIPVEWIEQAVLVYVKERRYTEIQRDTTGWMALICVPMMPEQILQAVSQTKLGKEPAPIDFCTEWPRQEQLL